MANLSNSLIDKIFRSSRTYHKLASDSSKKNTSVRLGITGIIETVVWTAIIIGLALCFKYVIANNTADLNGVLFVILAVIVGALLVTSVIGEVFSIVNIIYQFKLNKKPIRWIALAIWIIMIAGAILGSILIIAQ